MLSGRLSDDSRLERTPGKGVPFGRHLYGALSGETLIDSLKMRLCRRNAERTMPHPRRYLLYCPTENGEHLGEFFGEDRLFDVALNEYTGNETIDSRAEWRFATRGHKWPCIAKNLLAIDSQYEVYAFLDPDIEVTTDALNRLFLVGDALGLRLYQPALSVDSFFSHPDLLQMPNSYVRITGFVEIMTPFFHRVALDACRWTFKESQSGWGLDHLWPRVLRREGMAIVDAVPVRHARPVRSQDWRLDNGRTPAQELAALRAKFGL